MKPAQRNITKISLKNYENQAEMRKQKTVEKILKFVYKNIEKYCQELQYFSITQIGKDEVRFLSCS